MSRKIEYLLKDWAKHTIRSLQWADHYGTNVLHRAALFTGRSGRPGHVILSHDVPPSVRRTDRAIRTLSDCEQNALLLWYGAPINEETGKYYTHQDVARVFGITTPAFRKRLYRAKRKFKKSLELS